MTSTSASESEILLDPSVTKLNVQRHYDVPRLSRSPHPYYRRGSEVDSSQRPAKLSPTVTPYHSDSESSEKRYKHGPASYSRPQTSRTPSESGSEGDEEGLRLVRSLPPPPLKPRKGLREGVETQHGESTTPLLTPAQVDAEGEKLGKGYFSLEKKGFERIAQTEDIRKAEDRFYRRRRAELLRRFSEVLCLGLVSLIVVSGPPVFEYVIVWHRGLLSFCTTLVVLYFLYPVRIVLKPLWSGQVALGTVRVPSAFDPAPLLYPTVLPPLMALSLFNLPSCAVLLNLTLGLSAIPSPIIPNTGYDGCYDPFHWLVSAIPLIASENTAWPWKLFPSIPYRLLPPALRTVHPETLILLFPLHQTLLSPLHYLTTTSLLTAEHQLLSILLINVLYLATSPQSRIPGIILWVGGLGLFVFCGRILKWNVAIERMPNWRFQRAARVIQASNIFIGFLKSVVESPKSPIDGEPNSPISAGVDMNTTASAPTTPITQGTSTRRFSQPAHLAPRLTLDGKTTSTANGTLKPINQSSGLRGRRLTSPLQHLEIPNSTKASEVQRRAKSSGAYAYLAMTPKQINLRKWLHAGYTYAVVLTLILTVIRAIVSTLALNGYEPFGWAIGYLFGEIPFIQTFVESNDLQNWIPMSKFTNSSTTSNAESLKRLDFLRQRYIGVANTRLVLFSYWAVTICIGIACVLRLSSIVEVDTRRKVFHGMMVAMLLPTTFIDPAFLSLGLTLVLAVFLLLDLFRASQLQPISKPLARFLTPYVDGRDLRGPVVVSPIFLLIGCAIPLWLSIANIERTGVGPWRGWELATRDVSMIAGVVCVGMGDAAASLIGRRYGRRKWPWAGGKSLEGSAAFALAVTVGLLCGKAWLDVGGWMVTNPQTNPSWAVVVCKAAIAACGASFTEAVLTGCNDNVVVPVILWLLVRGLDL